MSVLFIIALFDSDDIQHGAGVLLVTADLFRLYDINYHQLNMYSKFGRRQSCLLFHVWWFIL